MVVAFAPMGAVALGGGGGRGGWSRWANLERKWGSTSQFCWGGGEVEDGGGEGGGEGEGRGEVERASWRLGDERGAVDVGWREPVVVVRGDTAALGMLVDEDWEDLRRMMVGRRLEEEEEELATKEGFFLEGLLELGLVGGGDRGVRDEDGLAWEEEARRGGREMVSMVGKRSVSLKVGWAEVGVGESSSSSLSVGSCLLDFQVGVRILAVLAWEVEDSARGFLRMGGGLDEPLRRPFSSSIDGG